jgi:hypothetical protein
MHTGQRLHFSEVYVCAIVVEGSIYHVGETDMKQDEKLLTTGAIARQEGVPTSTVNYAIASYQIEPRQRAGILRLYDQAGVDAIRSAMRRIRDRAPV